MPQEPRMWQGSSLRVDAVENGYIVTVTCFDTSITLVAKHIGEVLTILADTDLRVTTRPLPPDSLPPSTGSVSAAVGALRARGPGGF